MSKTKDSMEKYIESLLRNWDRANGKPADELAEEICALFDVKLLKMEAKEKARELYDKMCYQLIVDGGSKHDEAINCAQVLCDEQITECKSGFSYTDFRRRFWENVKDELDELR